jgi:hypothetical protein
VKNAISDSSVVLTDAPGRSERIYYLPRSGALKRLQRAFAEEQQIIFSTYRSNASPAQTHHA